MSGMSPGPPGPFFFFSGFSAIMHAVLSRMRATLLPFSSAVRTTLVGSITPIFIRSPYSPVSALKPKFTLSLACTLASTTLPS